MLAPTASGAPVKTSSRLMNWMIPDPSTIITRSGEAAMSALEATASSSPPFVLKLSSPVQKSSPMLDRDTNP